MPRDERDDEPVDHPVKPSTPGAPSGLGEGLGAGGFLSPDEDEDAEDADAPTVIDQRGVFFRDAFRESEKPAAPKPAEAPAPAPAPAPSPAPSGRPEVEGPPLLRIALGSLLILLIVLGSVYSVFFM